MMGLLGALGAAIAIVASAVGAIVAVDQLTLRTRARRMEAWARDVLEHEEDEHRAALLQDIQVQATSRVIASLQVPLRKFAEVILWVGLGPTVIITALLRDASTSYAISSIAAAYVAMWLILRRGIRLYAERNVEIVPVLIGILGVCIVWLLIDLVQSYAAWAYKRA